MALQQVLFGLTPFLPVTILLQIGAFTAFSILVGAGMTMLVEGPAARLLERKRR